MAIALSRFALAPVPIAIAFVTSLLAWPEAPLEVPDKRSFAFAPVPMAMPTLPDWPFMPNVIPDSPAVADVYSGFLISNPVKLWTALRKSPVLFSPLFVV